jgi:hypothetical protein
MATILKEEKKNKQNIAYVIVSHINTFVYIFEKKKDSQITTSNSIVFFMKPKDL